MSMKKIRKTYTQDFKTSAVAALEEAARDPEQTVEGLAQELEINLSLLYSWRKALQGQTPEQAFPGKGHLSDEQAEIARLRREVTQLKEERDFLHKAAAYFAKK